eukprot:GSChrysophyteH1.ASY1.ANO1.2854.1 assembled CDS
MVNTTIKINKFAKDWNLLQKALQPQKQYGPCLLFSSLLRSSSPLSFTYLRLAVILSCSFFFKSAASLAFLGKNKANNCFAFLSAKGIYLTWISPVDGSSSSSGPTRGLPSSSHCSNIALSAANSSRRFFSASLFSLRIKSLSSISSSFLDSSSFNSWISFLVNILHTSLCLGKASC